MAYSTDTEIITFIQELDEIIDHDLFEPGESWMVRLQSQFEQLKDELQSIHDEDGEPDPNIVYRNGAAGFAIGIGYTLSGFAALIDANDAQSDSEKLNARNLLWQGWSYTADGIARMIFSEEEATIG